MGTEPVDARKLERMKKELAILEAQEWAVKRAMENAIEVADLFGKQPDMIFTYTWFFGERKISATDIAEKINKFLPQIKKEVALKIAARYKLEKQIKELEEKVK